MTEQELFDTLFGRLCDSKDAHYAAMTEWFRLLPTLGDITEEERNRRRTEVVPPVYEVEAYAELAKDIETRDHTKLPAGSTVRIVMASRLGDLGITRNLNTQHGYETRVQPGRGYLTNCRLTKAP